MEYKLNLLTPSLYSPHGLSNCTDELVERFANYVKTRAEQEFQFLCQHKKTPGLAFIHDFEQFERLFLVHTEYAVILASAASQKALNSFIPRLLVFLTAKPIWQNRFLFVCLGPVTVLSNLVVHEPIQFSTDDWIDGDEPSWVKLFNLLKVTWVPHVIATTPKSPTAAASFIESIKPEVKETITRSVQGPIVKIENYHFNKQKSVDGKLYETKECETDTIDLQDYLLEEEKFKSSWIVDKSVTDSEDESEGVFECQLGPGDYRFDSIIEETEFETGQEDFPNDLSPSSTNANLNEVALRRTTGSMFLGENLERQNPQIGDSRISDSSKNSNVESNIVNELKDKEKIKVSDELNYTSADIGKIQTHSLTNEKNNKGIKKEEEIGNDSKKVKLNEDNQKDLLLPSITPETIKNTNSLQFISPYLKEDGEEIANEKNKRKRESSSEFCEPQRMNKALENSEEIKNETRGTENLLELDFIKKDFSKKDNIAYGHNGPKEPSTDLSSLNKLDEPNKLESKQKKPEKVSQLSSRQNYDQTLSHDTVDSQTKIDEKQLKSSEKINTEYSSPLLITADLTGESREEIKNTSKNTDSLRKNVEKIPNIGEHSVSNLSLSSGIESIQDSKTTSQNQSQKEEEKLNIDKIDSQKKIDEKQVKFKSDEQLNIAPHPSLQSPLLISSDSKVKNNKNSTLHNIVEEKREENENTSKEKADESLRRDLEKSPNSGEHSVSNLSLSTGVESTQGSKVGKENLKEKEKRNSNNEKIYIQKKIDEKQVQLDSDELLHSALNLSTDSKSDDSKSPTIQNIFVENREENKNISKKNTENSISRQLEKTPNVEDHSLSNLTLISGIELAQENKTPNQNLTINDKLQNSTPSAEIHLDRIENQDSSKNLTGQKDNKTIRENMGRKSSESVAFLISLPAKNNDSTVQREVKSDIQENIFKKDGQGTDIKPDKDDDRNKTTRSEGVISSIDRHDPSKQLSPVEEKIQINKTANQNLENKELLVSISPKIQKEAFSNESPDLAQSLTSKNEKIKIEKEDDKTTIHSQKFSPSINADSVGQSKIFSNAQEKISDNIEKNLNKKDFKLFEDPFDIDLSNLLSGQVNRNPNMTSSNETKKDDKTIEQNLKGKNLESKSTNQSKEDKKDITNTKQVEGAANQSVKHDIDETSKIKVPEHKGKDQHDLNSSVEEKSKRPLETGSQEFITSKSKLESLETYAESNRKTPVLRNITPKNQNVTRMQNEEFNSQKSVANDQTSNKNETKPIETTSQIKETQPDPKSDLQSPMKNRRRNQNDQLTINNDEEVNEEIFGPFVPVKDTVEMSVPLNNIEYEEETGQSNLASNIDSSYFEWGRRASFFRDIPSAFLSSLISLPSTIWRGPIVEVRQTSTESVNRLSTINREGSMRSYLSSSWYVLLLFVAGTVVSPYWVEFTKRIGPVLVIKTISSSIILEDSVNRKITVSSFDS